MVILSEKTKIMGLAIPPKISGMVLMNKLYVWSQTRLRTAL